ncbi:flavodoxin domain-containing protein [Streptomyces sp. Q6]|uniref:Flavodoxin domain-containing protein n=1 Tax=Streptomyces citrinus TaxID=3118173 RepID=A0ACD5ALZ5_9ACTN
MTVLIAYASVHGSTRSLAERIAERLTRRGFDVTVTPLGAAPDVTPPRAVVLGSAVHDGAWLPEAAGYVRERRAQLFATPVWMFSVGMAAALPRPLRRLATRREPPRLARLVDAVEPRGYHRFSGVIRRDHLDRRGRILFRLLGCRYGDHRDWDEVDAWADTIAQTLAG